MVFKRSLKVLSAHLIESLVRREAVMFLWSGISPEAWSCGFNEKKNLGRYRLQ